MTLMETIRDLFGMTPKGPTYTVEDIGLHYGWYVDNVKEALSCFNRMLTDKDWCLAMKPIDGRPDLIGLLADVKWKYLNTLDSWVEREFIRKIIAFRNDRPAVSGNMSERYRRNAYGHDDLLSRGVAYAECARPHARLVSDALSFFLCDNRSTWACRKSLFGGDCTVRELSDWYMGGYDIVKTNFKRIDDNFNEYAAFARLHARG